MNRQEAAAALRVNHRNPEAWYTLGRAFAEDGDREKARESYERALRYDPTFVEARRALAALDAPPLPKWLQEEQAEPAPVEPISQPAEPAGDVPDWFEEYSAPAGRAEPVESPREPSLPEPALPEIPDWMLAVPPTPVVTHPEPEPEPQVQPPPTLPSWLEGASSEPLLIKPASARPERSLYQAIAEPVELPAPTPEITGRSWSFWAAVAGSLFLLLCSGAFGLMWITGEEEPAAGRATESSTPVAQAAAPTRPPTWTPIGPTATATPSPTPLPTPTASLTGEAYTHPGFEVWWQRPSSDWIFSESPPFDDNDTAIPLVTLASAHGTQKAELVVLALSSNYPPSTFSFINFLLKVSPDDGLEAIEYEIGLPLNRGATVVEVARNPAVQMDTSEGVAWFIFRPRGVFMVAAYDFERPEDVHPLLSGLLFTNQTLESEARTLEEQRAQLVRASEQLRELGTRQAVPFAFKDQPTLRRELLQDMAHMDADAIKAEEQMLKLLRVIPESMNLLELSLELYSSHIAGFYDPEEATFYLISEDTGNEPLDLETRMVFVHEYTHALQDQHYGLGSLAEGQMNNDESLAYRSLVEGDAQWLTLLYLINNTGMNEIDDLLDLLPSVNTAALAASPYYVRSAFTFPYIEGLAFVQNVQLEGGWGAVAELWKNPPRSTEQIMHPEQYPSDEPTTVTLPEGLAASMGEGWREPLRDTTGELGLLLLLQQYDLELIGADKAAKGWDGDQYLFLTNGERGIYVQEFVWDRSFDGAEAAKAFQDWFEINGLSSEDNRHFLGERRAGYVYPEGDRLYFAIAHTEEELAIVLAALGWK